MLMQLSLSVFTITTPLSTVDESQSVGFYQHSFAGRDGNKTSGNDNNSDASFRI